MFGIKQQLEKLWDKPLISYPQPKRALIHAARIVQQLGHDLISGGITLRAMSLVYTTLLSLVPLLALSFSILKAFGVHDALEPMLLNLLAPLGPDGATMVDTIIGFVDNAKVGVLGIVGILFLFYAAVSLIQKIEAGLNEIWRVPSSRSIGRRFTDYVSVLTVGPVVGVAALTITASLSNNDLVARLIQGTDITWAVKVWGRLLPIFMIGGLFTFIYKFLPNTRVRLKAAIIGAFVAAILWQLLSVGFAYFGSQAGNYKAIYSGFAIVLLLMIWLYAAWLIVLAGAQIAFYVQYPAQMRGGAHAAEMAPRDRRELALACTTSIIRRWRGDTDNATSTVLASELNVPENLLQEVMQPLFTKRIIACIESDPDYWLPGRDPDVTPMNELLEALDSYAIDRHEDKLSKLMTTSHLHTSRSVMNKLDQTARECMKDMMVGDLSPMDRQHLAEETRAAELVEAENAAG